jgi:N-acetylglutamate synthase-like GNAT family acetyltransferase
MTTRPVIPTDPVVIRSARKTDLGDLIALMGAVVPACLPETVWQLPWAWRDYVVAVSSEGLIAAGSLQDIDGTRAEIRGLAVHPDHRGRGLASRIVEALVARADVRGRATVCVTRKPGFFAKHGFTETPSTWLPAQRVLFSKPGPSPRVGMQRLTNERSA